MRAARRASDGRLLTGARALLQRRIGPWSGRVWGLVVNLAANAALLWGVSSVLRTGSGWVWVVVGGMVTVACIAVLALPDRSADRVE